jgi:NAD(P)-dependent dehydrogenase (short-subunit alcohol dehydrogenase family)
MKHIVITGGTDGMGKVTAMHFLKQGDRVMVVGSTPAKGEKFLAEARQMGAGDRAIFVQANLSSIQENQRVIEIIKQQFDSLDMLIFCAGKFQNHYTETQDGFETTFATYYLSRYILSYGLKDVLEKAQNPIIFNVAAPGIKGNIQWDDIQFRTNYKGLKVSFHGSRLNDLLGVAFAENANPSTIKYVLYNPGFVRTAGVTEAFDNPVGKLIVKVVARLFALSPEQSGAYIIELLENLPSAPLSAYNQKKVVDLTMETFNPENAQRLYRLTEDLLKTAQTA